VAELAKNRIIPINRQQFCRTLPYPIGALPEESQLVADLQALVKLYTDMFGSFGSDG